MQMIRFRFQGRHTSTDGFAEVVESIQDGVKKASKKLEEYPGELATKQIGRYNSFSIFENYKDSGSDDIYYFAVEIE